jgi:hypothetical protein
MSPFIGASASCMNLICWFTGSGQSPARPLVKVMVTNQQDRVLSKQKTSYRTNTLTPYYNETLEFDVKKDDIQVVAIAAL